MNCSSGLCIRMLSLYLSRLMPKLMDITTVFLYLVYAFCFWDNWIIRTRPKKIEKIVNDALLPLHAGGNVSSGSSCSIKVGLCSFWYETHHFFNICIFSGIACFLKILAAMVHLVWYPDFICVFSISFKSLKAYI